MNDPLKQLSKDYYRIEKAIYFLGENFQRQPGLQEMADLVGISEYHFQRTFQRWAGISPKRFLQFLSKEYAKKLLQKSSLLDVSYETGLSGPGRLHDLFVSCDAMSPGEYKQKGKGLTIDYGFHPTPFGECFIALTGAGVCSLSFVEPARRKNFLEIFREDWKNARTRLNQDQTKEWIKKIFASERSSRTETINVLFRGTNFQIKVWEALLKIPAGTVVTYKALAQMIGCPQAARAVGNAVGKNPIAYLIPCHRVIRGVGQLGGYRWGIVRKKVMLGKEAAEPPDPFTLKGL